MFRHTVSNQLEVKERSGSLMIEAAFTGPGFITTQHVGVVDIQVFHDGRRLEL